MEPTSRFVQANGITLHGLTWGDPDSPLLIMIHGIALCSMVWRPLAEDLARDYYVFSLDLRGHGDSDKPGGYTFDNMAEDLVGLVDALNPSQPPYAVGHSAGGMTIMIANSKAPGTVGPTVLVDTRVGPALEVYNPEEREERMNRTRNKRAIWETREIMYDAYRNRAGLQHLDRRRGKGLHLRRYQAPGRRQGRVKVPHRRGSHLLRSPPLPEPHSLPEGPIWRLSASAGRHRKLSR